MELTKRYYVSMKAEKLREELEKLSKDQEKQSEEPDTDNTKENATVSEMHTVKTQDVSQR